MRRIVFSRTWPGLLAWLDTQRDRLVPWLAVCMAAGVLTWLALPIDPWGGLGVTATGVLGGLCVLGRRREAVLLPTLPLLAVAAGFASAQWAAARAPPMAWSLPTHATIVAGIIAAVEPLPDNRRITLERVTLDGTPAVHGRTVRVRLRPTDHMALATGQAVRVRAMLRPVAGPAFPGAWDPQRDAFFSGLGASGYALGPVEVVTGSDPSHFMARVQRLREVISDRIAAAIPGPSGQVAVGILIGTQTGISAADMAAFRDSGLAHLLSVSGLHLTIVLGCAAAFVRLVLLCSEQATLFWPVRTISTVAALAVGGAYTLLTGLQVPMLRCFLVAVLFAVALLADRRPFSLRSLGLAAIAIMVVDPAQVGGASMQMSFGAVMALVTGFEALRPWVTQHAGDGRLRRAGLFVAGLALTSALAGTATLPLGAWHFGRIQTWYVVSNMLAVPLTSILVMPFGMAALPLMLVGLEWIALVPVGWGIELTLWIARATAALPGATLPVPRPPTWGIAAMALGLAWLCLWSGRVRLLGVVLLAGGIASPALDRRPDILVSSDARLIAVHLGGTVFLQQTQGGNPFVRDSWLHMWGIAQAAPFPADSTGALACAADGCRLAPHADAPSAFLVRRNGKPGDCGGIGVIVSAEPARGLCPRPWPALVDRFTVWRDGPAAIWLTPVGAQVLTDRAVRGTRPWVPPPPTPRPPRAPNLPLAPTEGGPGTPPPESWQHAAVPE